MRNDASHPASHSSRECDGPSWRQWIHPTCRLFVKKRRSKIDFYSKVSFLVDTKMDLCVFLTDDSQAATKIDVLSAANETIIHTYGTVTLTLNLGLRTFAFRGRGIEAYPLVGADFLSYYGLLVNLQNSRLVDQIMSLAAIGRCIQCH